MKKIRPELKPAASGRPGVGVFVLTSWDRESLEFGAGAEVCVQRNQDHRYLGEHGQWTATQTWHQVSLSEELIDISVVLALDARLVDPLVENPQMTYQLQVRIGSEEAIGVLRMREGVLSSRAAGQSVDPVNHVADVQQVVAADSHVPPLPEVAEPAPETMTQPSQKQSKIGWWVALIALLILVIAGFFVWKYFGSTAEPVTTSSTVNPTLTNPAVLPAEPPAAPAEPAPCSTEALAATKDDLLFIQTCLKTQPDSDQVLNVITKAKDAKRCDVVQRLYAFKGQSGDAKVALAYAREFDPATFVAGCLSAADKDTAIYWYELVLSKEPENTDAKTRLEALRK